MAARLFWAPQALADRDLEGLPTLPGKAPVTRRSGESQSVSIRCGCNSRMRDAVRHWAGTNARTKPFGRALYWAMRARGHGHERAL